MHKLPPSIYLNPFALSEETTQPSDWPPIEHLAKGIPPPNLPHLVPGQVHDRLVANFETAKTRTTPEVMTQHPELTSIFTIFDNLIRLFHNKRIVIVVQNYSPKDPVYKRVTVDTYFFVMYSEAGEYIGELICETATIKARDAAFARKRPFTRGAKQKLEDAPEVPSIHIRWIGIDGVDCVGKGYGILLLMFGICSCFINYLTINYSYLEDCSAMSAHIITLYTKLGYIYNDEAELKVTLPASPQEKKARRKVYVRKSPDNSVTILTRQFSQSSNDTTVRTGDFSPTADDESVLCGSFYSESCLKGNALQASDISVGERTFIISRILLYLNAKFPEPTGGFRKRRTSKRSKRRSRKRKTRTSKRRTRQRRTRKKT